MPTANINRQSDREFVLQKPKPTFLCRQLHAEYAVVGHNIPQPSGITTDRKDLLKTVSV